MLFSHGNGELIDHWVQPFARLRDRGINVALVEFRGYGRSTGQPDENRLVADFCEAAAILRERESVDASRVVYFGRSLGGGVVCGAAARQPPAALVLASTFTSVPALAQSLMGIPAFAISQKFDNLQSLKAYQGPVLISHGTHDEIVPFKHALELEAAGGEVTLSKQPCGHNDWPVSWEDWLDELTRWLAGVIG
ncbi:MAG: pimeloyl-ACP methyl ester carboxylesterase [Bradymonadia bacterium]